MLKHGEKGSQVVEVQKMLKALGIYKDKIDGIFVVNTESAVNAFQRSKQIKIDGIIGPVTYSLLKKDYSTLVAKNEIAIPVIKPAPRKIDTKNIKKADVKYIIIHHSASDRPLTWEEIDREHKKRGFEGFGYHFLVDPDGTIWAGRALNKEAILNSSTVEIGAQAKGINSISVGICFNGNFEKGIPTKDQIEAGKLLVRWLKYKVFNKPGILGHKEVVKIVPGATITACPGKNFPLDAFKSL